MSKAEKARQIVKEFPHTSKKELGKILHQRNPILFKDAEDEDIPYGPSPGPQKVTIG
jgi:hypothetical protein